MDESARSRDGLLLGWIDEASGREVRVAFVPPGPGGKTTIADALRWPAVCAGVPAGLLDDAMQGRVGVALHGLRACPGRSGRAGRSDRAAPAPSGRRQGGPPRPRGRRARCAKPQQVASRLARSARRAAGLKFAEG
jgi:hypothetical protein